MIKFLGPGVSAVKYVLTQDDKIPHAKSMTNTTNKDGKQAAPSIQSLNDLGKRLLLAAASGDLTDVKILLSKGSPFISDWLGTSPLHLAAQHNRVDICEVLLQWGISKDARNKVDKTPLHLAAYEGHYEACETLIKHGADVNCQDMLYMTPLHWAVQYGHTEVVELLLRNGADTTIKNKFELIPQDIAIQIDKLEIVQLLKAYENSWQSASEGLQAAGSEEDDVIDTTDVFSQVIIVDGEELNSLSESLQQKDDVEAQEDAVPVQVNLSYSRSSKDPVIINLPGDVNDEIMPQISTAKTDLNNAPSANLKIIEEEEEGSFSAMQLLQEHGIAMLPTDNDDSNILNAVMENGHSVVLTDVGKEVLNSVKRQEENELENMERLKASEVLNMAPDNYITVNQADLPPMKAKNVRRVTIKKKKNTPQLFKGRKSELECVLEELAEAKKTIEEYKSKLKKKETEVERYKMQLKLLMDNS